MTNEDPAGHVHWWNDGLTALPSRMNNPFDYEPHPLCLRAYGEILEWKVMSEPSFLQEILRGKMLGVLIVKSADSRVGFLAAFSGQICNRFDWPGFIPPVFDYLHPDGYFKRGEEEITTLNRKIADIEQSKLPTLTMEAETVARLASETVASAKSRMVQAKNMRDERRRQGNISPAEEQEMIAESQYLKANLRRAKMAMHDALAPLNAEIEVCNSLLTEMKSRRRKLSIDLQHRIFSDFKMLNAQGQAKDLNEIFHEFDNTEPPSGSGECCAPKLLQYAFSHRLQPVAISEFWYGKSPDGEVRSHGAHYPACRSKCLPILSWMLRGLDIEPDHSGLRHSYLPETPDIIFENSDFCVINKPAGLLSVPGKGAQPSAVSIMTEHYGRSVFAVHRLDRDTSGLLLLAFDVITRSRLQRLFESRAVKKTYVALLDGDIRETDKPWQGRISLPLSPDFADRPRQKVNHESGKDAVTDYTVLSIHNGLTLVEFKPLTGRTHQLRVHSASAEGLGLPIVGDTLYYKALRTPSRRMMLHAIRIAMPDKATSDALSFEATLPEEFHSQSENE